jgi:hypothetical protein
MTSVVCDSTYNVTYAFVTCAHVAGDMPRKLILHCGIVIYKSLELYHASVIEMFFKFHSEYLKVVEKYRFDPIILLLSLEFSNSLRDTIVIYLLAVAVVHITLIFLKYLFEQM